MKTKNCENAIFTIPNILSMVRMLFLPVYAYLYVWREAYLLSAVLLAVSMITDAIDGIVARKFNMISTLGKVLDPIADKLTQACVFFCLSFRWWAQLKYVVIVLVLKESFMLVMGIINLKKGRMLDGALKAGKLCTTVLFVSMGLLVILPCWNLANEIPLVTVLSVLCCCAMLISFGFYLSTYMGGKHGVDIVPIRKDGKV